MNFTQIIKELESASSFDMYRLISAMQDEIDSEQRIRDVRKGLRVGQIISWFNQDTHLLVKAEILKLNKTRCQVRNIDDLARWDIVYACINTQDVDVEININQKYGVKKSELKVGDVVTYVSRDNLQVYGIVTKLNPKTAGINVNSENWRVPYSMLSRAVDINGEIIEKNFLVEKKLIEQ